jgi:hypothetical protein
MIAFMPWVSTKRTVATVSSWQIGDATERQDCRSAVRDQVPIGGTAIALNPACLNN